MVSLEQPAVVSSLDDQRTTFTVGHDVTAQEHHHMIRAKHGPERPTEECSTVDSPVPQPAGTDDTNKVLSAVRDMVLSVPFEDDDMLRRRIYMILASGP